MVSGLGLWGALCTAIRGNRDAGVEGFGSDARVRGFGLGKEPIAKMLIRKYIKTEYRDVTN